nr:MAG TPA: hypothetical protein [Caudoviricetes sp.]
MFVNFLNNFKLEVHFNMDINIFAAPWIYFLYLFGALIPIVIFITYIIGEKRMNVRKYWIAFDFIVTGIFWASILYPNEMGSLVIKFFK